MQANWMINNGNIYENIFTLDTHQKQRNWMISSSFIEERRDSFDGFNFDYELNRISEAYQIKDLQLLNVEHRSISSNNTNLDYQKSTNSKDYNANQLQNPVFKIIYPLSFKDELNQTFNPTYFYNGLKRNSEDTQSHISPSKDLYKIDNSLYDEPISEVIRRINDIEPKKKEKSKKANFSYINQQHPNVFRIDDGLYFLENKEGNSHKKDAKSVKVKEKGLIKTDGRQPNEKKMEFLLKKKSICKIKQNGNEIPKQSAEIKKIIKKKKTISLNKKKWGYIKNDFIYYGSNQHKAGEFPSKESFMIKIPLSGLKE